MTSPTPDTNGRFYLGRTLDPATNQPTGQSLLYDPADLTTHGVVVGMTGSGKTGLCLALMEEAALNGLPALMIDPKGDITNALLHFPNLAPADFQPWINPGEARRAGKTVEEAAADTAQNWRDGLADWGIGPERLAVLQSAVRFAVYTPGSDAGLPVNILASFQAPTIPWAENRELLREKIAATVTAILGLVGLKDVDPLRSREHILLSNIFEHAWSRGDDLDLGELILMTQSPPFVKLGVFDVNTFIPEATRFELAMLLNNILAAPAFQSWIEGEPLNIANLLYTADGRPRHTIFYIAHLSDAERMFFVTLLLSAVESWMRAQSGTAALRALVYFDEIIGYLPPIGNPPSKTPLLRLLKQARAFGLGLLLASQNPVDIDYKALANAGTWFIGKLQTEQDKQRLLDGLTGATAALDRGRYDQLISGLNKRHFLLHNVHAAQPVLFQTRWAMNYLAGPLTRTQIPTLNALAEAANSQLPISKLQAPISTPQPPLQNLEPSPPPHSSSLSPQSSSTRPTVPSGIAEYFLPANLTPAEGAKAIGRELPVGAEITGLFYRPVLLAQAAAHFINRKYNLDYDARYTAIVPEVDRRSLLRWEEFTADPIDPRRLERGPVANARFAPLEGALTDAKVLKSLSADFLDYTYRTLRVMVKANEALQLYAAPNVPESDFRKQAIAAAVTKRDAEATKALRTIDTRLQGLYSKLSREQRQLKEDEMELEHRKREEMGTHAENILGIFGAGRRHRMTTSLTKRRLTEQAKSDVIESQEEIEELDRQIAAVLAERQQTIDEITARWTEIANRTTELPVTPYKKDVSAELFGVAWFPYHLLRLEDKVYHLPAAGPKPD
jgi:hypothetical protein